MSNGLKHHLTDGELLHYADGELSSREAAAVQSHLATCWECRTQLEEIQRTIGECVRYRRAVSAGCATPPPKPWFDIQRQLAEIDATTPARWFSIGWLRWATLAASGIGVWALVQQFRAPEVKPPAHQAPVVRQEAPPAPRLNTPVLPPAAPAVRSPAPTSAEELQVFAALRRLDADLGEPIEVTRNETRIIVSGVGIDGNLERRIEEELRGLARVEVNFSDPPAEVEQPAEGTTAAQDAGAAQLQRSLEQQVGGRAAFDQLADEVLGVLEMVMSRIHAIRRLAERFPPEVEAGLPDRDRALLASLHREHSVALRSQIAAIDHRMAPLLLALGASTPPVFQPPAVPWQFDASNLLREARSLERAVAVMLGGAGTDRALDGLASNALASLKIVREKAEWNVQATGPLR